MCPAKYFLHDTANPISSFRKLCHVNSRVSFIEQLGLCLSRIAILLTANKMHTEDFLSPSNVCTLASLLPHTSTRQLPAELLCRGGLVSNGENQAPSLAQNLNKAHHKALSHRKSSQLAPRLRK